SSSSPARWTSRSTPRGPATARSQLRVAPCPADGAMRVSCVPPPSGKGPRRGLACPQRRRDARGSLAAWPRASPRLVASESDGPGRFGPHQGHPPLRREVDARDARAPEILLLLPPERNPGPTRHRIAGVGVVLAEPLAALGRGLVERVAEAVVRGHGFARGS